MKILIENYRGFDIGFNNDNELFYCVVTTENKDSKSFSAIKKFIDEYIKDNYKFEPFRVIKDPNQGWGRSDGFTVTGIRKDGLFVGQDAEGKKVHVSDYEEKYYILDIPENNIKFANIAVLELEMDAVDAKIKLAKKSIKAISLEELKPKYIQPK